MGLLAFMAVFAQRWRHVSGKVRMRHLLCSQWNRRDLIAGLKSPNAMPNGEGRSSASSTRIYAHEIAGIF